jgi:hypothetical protein
VLRLERRKARNTVKKNDARDAKESDKHPPHCGIGQRTPQNPTALSAV